MENLIREYGEYAVACLVFVILGIIAVDYWIRRNYSINSTHGAADDARTKPDGRDRIQAYNAIYDAGQSMFWDFDSSVESFSKLGGATSPFLDVLVTLRMDHAAKIFYHLGQHPNEAARVMKLRPKQIQQELATYSALIDSRDAKADLPPPDPPADPPTGRPAFGWVPPLSPEPSTGRALILLFLLAIQAGLWIVWLGATGILFLALIDVRPNNTAAARDAIWFVGVGIWIAGAWAGWHIAGLPRRWAYSAIYGESDRLRVLTEEHLKPPQK